MLLGWSISSSKPRSRYRLAFRIHPINPLRRIYPSSEPKICVLRLRPPLNVKLGNFTLKLKLCSDSNVMYCKVCCTCKVVLLIKPTAFLAFSLPSWSLMPKAPYLPIFTGTGDQAICQVVEKLKRKMSHYRPKKWPRSITSGGRLVEVPTMVHCM